MRILHIGWGFQTFRSGGLIEYAEDLMSTQAKKGYSVYYFCTGRFSIFISKPTLKKWKSGKGYWVYELWNPPIIGGFDKGISKPLCDNEERLTEKMLLETIIEVKPSIIHFQEFLGIPTSVIRQIKNLSIKTVFTVQDYFVLCPVLKLVKTDGAICTIKTRDLGKECAKCCANAPVNNSFYRFKLTFRDFFTDTTREAFMTMVRSLGRLARRKPELPNQTIEENKEFSQSEAYNTRRAFNLTALLDIDVIIAMSNRVASIFNYYQNFKNISVLNLTLSHIDKLKPQRFEIAKEQKIRFGLINVLGSNLLKGKKLMLDVFAKIEVSFLKDAVQFYILGNTYKDDRELLGSYSFIKIYGTYEAENLDKILDELKLHVGIVPSIWEEAYGYVGVELLAKGIPVIGNNIGGIADYVINKETGWLNNSCSSEEMFEIIAHIISNPKEVQSLNANLIVNRNKYIKSFDDHFYEMDSIYKNLLDYNKPFVLKAN